MNLSKKEYALYIVTNSEINNKNTHNQIYIGQKSRDYKKSPIHLHIRNSKRKFMHQHLI